LVSIVGIVIICSVSSQCGTNQHVYSAKEIVESTSSHKNFGGAISNQVTDQPEGSVGEGVVVVVAHDSAQKGDHPHRMPVNSQQQLLHRVAVLHVNEYFKWLQYTAFLTLFPILVL
jgi:hypothetical protein